MLNGLCNAYNSFFWESRRVGSIKLAIIRSKSYLDLLFGKEIQERFISEVKDG